MAKTSYLAKFTPSTVESRRTMAGHAQLRARGVIENKLGGRVRSVIAYGRLHDEIKPHLEEGRPVLLRGYYERVQNRDGSEGGEFFKPFAVVKTYERPVPPEMAEPARVEHAKTGRTVEGHNREGYFRWQRCGKGRTELRRVWVRASKVNGGKK